jgi:hypothetical protein
VAVDLPVVGRRQVPRPEELAYYATLVVLAATEIIDWPVALALAAGHGLTHRHQSRVAQGLGEALEDSRAAEELGEALHEGGVMEELGETLAELPG